MLRYDPPISSLFKVFIVIICWILMCWDHYVTLTLDSIYALHCIYLHLLDLYCNSGMKANWSWWVIFVMYCWVHFASILLMIFALVFINDIDCVCPSQDQSTTGFIKWASGHSVLFHFMEYIETLGESSATHSISLYFSFYVICLTLQSRWWWPQEKVCGDWILGLTPARQVLYHLSYATSLGIL
jgi:hypothetical protein